MKHKLILKKWQQITLLCLLPVLAAGGLLLAKDLYVRYVIRWVPPCILRTVTGWQCPSCGMTHAVFALCRLDLIEALRQNALLIFGVVLAALRYAEMWLKALGKPKKLIPRSGGFWIGALIFWLGYAVLRNVV